MLNIIETGKLLTVQKCILIEIVNSNREVETMNKKSEEFAKKLRKWLRK
jgi:hypothetical protein